MKRCVLALLLLVLVLPVLLLPAMASASTILAPAIVIASNSEPAPEETEPPEATIPPEMELLATLLDKTLLFFQFEFTVFGFTLSFWGILLFLIIAGIVITLIGRFIR